MSSSPEPDAPGPPFWVVILAGGVGSRFWPVSTPSRPKQLLPIATDRPLIHETVERILPLTGDARLRVLAGRELVPALRAAVPLLGDQHFLQEPRARGTAPVLAWAAHEIERLEPGAVMASVHADHVISPASAFRELLVRTCEASVRHDRLFTIGAVPDRPETGYGYIRQGAGLAPGMAEVAEFIEKPPSDDAERYVREGFLWNTGLFVWPARLFLDELRRHTPELAAHLPLLDAGDVDTFFERAPSLSVDEGLLERSNRVAVARATFAWDDVGAWDAVARARAADAEGNVSVGRAHFVDAADNVAWADDGDIVIYGASNLVVVRSGGITFVAPRERTPELKRLLDRLPPELRDGESVEGGGG
jgi:mannose-1-phosphate guanylyltransferase